MQQLRDGIGQSPSIISHTPVKRITPSGDKKEKTPELFLGINQGASTIPCFTIGEINPDEYQH
jgi:hypothetical protein